MKLLARRERSCQGLRSSLIRAGIGTEAAAEVVDELAGKGWVDDFRYCRVYLLHHVRLRPRSLRLLERELRNEGCVAEAVQKALAELEDVTEEGLALEAARKGVRRARGNPDRLRAFLARRGFSRSTVEDTVSRLDLDGAADEGRAFAGDPGDDLLDLDDGPAG